MFSGLKKEFYKLEQPQDNTLAWHTFCKDFVELLNPNNPSALSLTYFIRRTLHSFHLNSVAESEVLAEVFLRAYKLVVLGRGVVIQPTAWVRKAALNHIRELSSAQKQAQKQVVFLESNVLNEMAHPLINKLILQANIAVLTRELQELEPRYEKEILQENFIQAPSDSRNLEISQKEDLNPSIFPLVEEYCYLSKKDNPSDEETERLIEILELGEDNQELRSVIQLVDHLVTYGMGLSEQSSCS
jgi:hypothetical protein